MLFRLPSLLQWGSAAPSAAIFRGITRGLLLLLLLPWLTLLLRLTLLP